MLEITAKADKLVEKYNMLSYGDYVVVGVSGGADSMVLLEYLLSKKDEYNLRLTVANVEHGIRGQESLDDTAFVKDYCINRGLDFSSLSINAVEEARQCGMGIEEYSRKRRYEFFESFNPDKIATAHNLSDNVETVLFRMARGTSAKGLCGIPAVRGRIIRPLLSCTGDEIRIACKLASIPYRIDSTNNDVVYSRNHIRHNVIPQLEKLNPLFTDAVSRMIASVNEDEDFLSICVEEAYSICFSDGRLITDRLKKQHPAILKRVIIKYLNSFDVSVDELHLNGILNCISNYGKYQIAGNGFVVCDKNSVRYALLCYNEEKQLIVNKSVIDYKDFLTNCKFYTKQFDIYFDCDKIIGNVYARYRKAGDRISPAGRDCSKSLKKLFNEFCVDVEKRNSIPVICDDDGVIGVCGCCVDERVRADKNTKNILLLKISLED